MSDCTYSPPGPIAISLQIGATVIVVGGVAMGLLPMVTHTSGASRSAHIKWQQRETAIEKVISKTNSSDSTMTTERKEKNHEKCSKKTDN